MFISENLSEKSRTSKDLRKIYNVNQNQNLIAYATKKKREF